MWEETSAALGTTVEEMRVAEEELRQQNEELERSRQAVEAERQRYQDLFDFAPDGYLVTDLSGMIREANRAAGELLGLPSSYLAGKPMANFLPMEERPAFRGGLHRLLQVGERRDWILRIQPRQGPSFDAAIAVAVVRDWDGAPLSLRWMFREVSRDQGSLLPSASRDGDGTATTSASPDDLASERSARLRAEGEADTFRRLLGGIDVIVWEADVRTGRYWFISPQVEDLLGYPAEHWLSEPEFWAEIVHPDDRSLAEAHRRRCLREGRPDELEYRVAAADGRFVWLRESLSIEPEDGGRPRSLRGSLCDITRRKAVERQVYTDRNELARHLADAWHLYHTDRSELIKHLADISQLYLCGSHLLSTMELLPTLNEILKAVTAFQGSELGLVRLFDRDRGELETVVSVGLPAAYLDRFGRVPVGVDLCGLAVASGEPVVVEDVESDPSAAGWAEAPALGGYRSGFSVPMISRSGELVGTIATFFREPHRRSDWHAKLIEQYVFQATAAIEYVRQHLAVRDSDRRKEEFLATLAHELRNPLAAIQTCGHLLYPDSADASTLEEIRDVIVRQTRYMSRLVEDLLDVTRISRGTIALRKERVDLAEVAARAVEDVRQLVEARGHHLSVTLPAAPVYLEADPTRLEQILSNLLTNAAKYTDPGGRIDLIATREAGELVLTVRDTGIGMTPEALVNVFDLFNQVEATSDRTRGGLGIGLALVKSLTERHGGTVSAHSAGPGLGSAFVVRLPIGSVEAPGPPVRAPSANRDGHQPLAADAKRVLIVVDEPDLAQMLARWVRSRGYAVDLAHNLQPALDAASIWPPQFVLLDLDLSGVDGLDVARRLRQQAGRLPRIVAMTGYSRAEDRDRAREAGIDDLRVKPIDLEDLDRWLESPTS